MKASSSSDDIGGNDIIGTVTTAAGIVHRYGAHADSGDIIRSELAAALPDRPASN